MAQTSSVDWIFETTFCKCFAFSCLILPSCGLLHETRVPHPFSGPSVRLNECKNYFLLLWCKNIHMVRQHVAFSIFTHSISSACVCANAFFVSSLPTVARGNLWSSEWWNCEKWIVLHEHWYLFVLRVCVMRWMFNLYFVLNCCS